MAQHINSTSRDHGIDLLRILSMMMVVALHIMTEGGLRNAADGHAVSHAVVWLFTAATCCAVNVYGLISGYVGCTARHRTANLLYLWCQTVFYSAGIVCVFCITHGIPKSEILRALTPVTSSYYWYFTAYAPLFFFMPALNHLISTLPKKKLLLLGGACIFWFSLVPFISGKDFLHTNWGYSFLWLAILYLLGGICRRLDLFRKVRVWQALGVYLLCCFVNLIGRDIFLRYRMFSPISLLFEYPAPITLLASLALLALFAGRKIPAFAVPAIRFLSPLSFGVYLIHVHPLVYGGLFHGQMGSLIDLHPLKLIVYIGLILLGIYLICTAIDAVRAQIFHILKIRRLCDWIDQKIAEVGERCFQ